MKLIRPAIALTLVFVVLTGLLFPAAIWGVSQAAFPHQANGSMIVNDGKVVGSELIGQSFASPKYFQPRPSAAGAGYDGANSSGTNLGPTNPKLLEGADGFDGVKQLAAAYRKLNEVPDDVRIPADAVSRSASGLDPHISPRNAELQAVRVAKERGVPLARIQKLVSECTEGPLIGVFGESRVHVLRLNLKLSEL
jgi:K+-transporting ATPase ATPase C chain